MRSAMRCLLCAVPLVMSGMAGCRDVDFPSTVGTIRTNNTDPSAPCRITVANGPTKTHSLQLLTDNGKVLLDAVETNRLAQAPYMTEVTDSGILVLLTTNGNSYAVLLRVDRQWTFYQASVTNEPTVAAYLGKPMRITARVMPKLDVVEGRMFQIVKIEQEDAEPSVAPLPRAPQTGHSGGER